MYVIQRVVFPSVIMDSDLIEKFMALHCLDTFMIIFLMTFSLFTVFNV